MGLLRPWSIRISRFIDVGLSNNSEHMNLSLQTISKTYDNGVRAIDQLSIEISPGMFGILGPNGAGKSTLMRTIATLQIPDTGRIFFNGEDIFDIRTDFRRQLGYLPQEFDVYPRETAFGLLDYFAILKGISSKKERRIRVYEVLEKTNLLDVRKRRVSTFSGGMRQRFGIAQLLLNQPKVIIVDEPTAGLDPGERTRFLNLLRNIGSDNIVLFSTHLVEDVKGLCKDMAVIKKGKLLSQIDPNTATRSLTGKIWESEMTESQLNDRSVSFLKLSDRYNEENRLVTRIYSEHCPVEASVSVSPKLEDYYFLMLNKE